MYNISYFNETLSYIPKEETITLSSCLKYTESIKEQNILIMVCMGILILYLLISFIKEKIKKGVKP
jgi:hypothetical protein